jgi:hypothetical protein
VANATRTKVQKLPPGGVSPQAGSPARQADALRVIADDLLRRAEQLKALAAEIAATQTADCACLPLLTESQVSELLSLTPRQVMRMSGRDELPVVVLPNGEVRFDRSEIERLVASLKRNG